MSWNNGGPSGGSPWGPPPGAPKDGPRPGGGGGSGGGGGGGSGGGGGGSGSGGGGGPGGPGRPGGPKRPWGNGGPEGPLPDLDALIARLQGFLRSLLPSGIGGGGGGGGRRLLMRGGGGGRGLALIVAGIFALWLASGFYRVQPDEQGVVLRFGAFNRTALPGLNYHIPWPVEEVLLPPVTRINRVEVGYRSTPGEAAAGGDGRSGPGPEVQEESLMLTGDENIIDINFTVFWRISDVVAYLFNTRHPASTVKSAAESVMREEIGRTPIQFALTEGRAKIETDVRNGVQAILDQYGAGVEITQVQLQKVDPPQAVIDSFRDVQRANTDADRMRNEAQAYHNDIVPRARGDAARIIAAADAERQAAIVEASGQAQRFLSVLKAYDAAKDVTLRRLYIETMQDVLSHSPSIIVDQKLQGVVPYLPLGAVGRTAPLPPAVAGTTP